MADDLERLNTALADRYRIEHEIGEVMSSRACVFDRFLSVRGGGGAECLGSS